MSEAAEVTDDVTLEQINLLLQAFEGRQYEGVVSEHEGTTHTFLFTTPAGVLGISVGLAGKGDMHVSVNEWEKRQHHELDEWVWVRK